MYLTIVRFFPDPDKIDAVRRYLAGVLGPTRVQPGCLGCTVSTESDPDALLYMETWQSKETLLRRLLSDEYAKVLATMELSATRPEVCVYEVISQQGLELIERVRMASQNGGGESHPA